VNKKLLLTPGIVCLCLISNLVFSQGSAVFDPITHTSHLPGGMTWSNNMANSVSQSFEKDFDQYSMRPILGNGNIFAYGSEYNTKGTRFLFDEWVKGIVVKNSGEVIDGDMYYFNFDKITSNLIVTVNKNDIVEVYKDSIQSFKVKERGKVYSFEKLASIQRYRFVQVLVKDKENYSLYKSINTRLIGANFTTNGLTETGNPYDEYVDMNKYYIVYKDQVRPVELKFISLKKALKENSSRVKDFYADHIMDEVDENYAINMVEFLNE
jgi:hypothetical protein